MVSAIQAKTAHWPAFFSIDSMTGKWKALRVASWLHTPVCRIRENMYRFYILDETAQSGLQKISQAAFLILGIVVYSLLAPFTTPVAIFIRAIVASCSTKNYVYRGADAQGKILPQNRQISFVSYNVCFMPAGCSITHGQVTPPTDLTRFNGVIQQLKGLDPDVICLFEVSDANDAAYLTSQLADYPFIIPIAGIGVGPSSMMYVASKYRIHPDSVSFVPFVKGVELTGPGALSEKGVLSFNIHSGQEKEPCAHIIATHLQHSETSSYPEAHEIQSRKIQSRKIIKQIQEKTDRENLPVIWTGDFNQTEPEFQAIAREVSQLLRRDPKVEGIPTWDGDEWSAKLMNKVISKPEVLDYTCIAGPNTTISTRVIETGYRGDRFTLEALSDHFVLYSLITLHRSPLRRCLDRCKSYFFHRF